MIPNDKIQSLVQLSNFLENHLKQKYEDAPHLHEQLDEAIQKSEWNNPWFTKENQYYILKYWAKHLKKDILESWLSAYNFQSKGKIVGLVLAGNIPMVGFHDVLCVILSGHVPQIKLSSKDSFLIPFMLEYWSGICDSVNFSWVKKLEKYDAVIATGSDNTARYFESYFSQVPHIIRSNRTSLAVLNGEESLEDLQALGQDIFTYFGLGCRNVTQLLLPQDFDPQRLFLAFFEYKDIVQHTKYQNAYDYYRATYLLNKDEFWDNNFMLLRKSENLFAPVSTVNYLEYESEKQILDFVEKNKNHIQAIVGNAPFLPQATVVFGHAQQPPLNSYADNVDVMQFLSSI